MIDAVLSISVFAALVLCIVGFDAWAPRRAQSRRADISLDL
jgi:hypothetical protein